MLPNHMSSKVDYEGELGIVIKEAKWINTNEAKKYILGLCVNDITARDTSYRYTVWSRKNFDTFVL